MSWLFQNDHNFNIDFFKLNIFMFNFVYNHILPFYNNYYISSVQKI